MSCNCKKKNVLEDKFGVIEEEPIGDKALRLLLRSLIFILAFILTVVLTPIILVVALYKVFFGKDDEIKMPKLVMNLINNG